MGPRWPFSRAEPTPVEGAESTATPGLGEAELASGPRTLADELRWLPPCEHAALLLAWARTAGRLTGWRTYHELHAAYRNMISEHHLVEHGWNAVGRELRKLLEQPKWTRGPKRERIYFIPIQAICATIDGGKIPQVE